MSDSAFLERIPTGIPGLDPILEGGLLKGAVYIVQGPPGAGKTIFGNQICYNHARSGGQAIYITLLTESHARMLAHLRRMSFFDPALVPERVYYMSGFKILEAEGLEGLATAMRRAITSRKASLLVLDGFVSAEEASLTPKELKKFIHELQSVTAMTECMALLLSSTDRPKAIQPEETVVDGILELSDDAARLTSLRYIAVKKMRGADQVRGKHTFQITSDGIIVRPRIETQLQGPTKGGEMTPGGERIAFGIPGLDQMLRGGVPSNSITMLLGPSGSGKTITGIHFLTEGARRGEPGVYFGFFERPVALREKSARMNLEVAELHDKGLLDFVWQRPIEGIIDILGERLISTIKRLKARRLFIDGINGFELALDDFAERIRGVLSALTEELERLGVTTVYSAETYDLFGPTVKPPIRGISGVTQNIIMLRYVELRSELRRLISIIKIRDSDYDPSIRELLITNQGVSVGEKFERADRILTGTALHPHSRIDASKEKSRAKKKTPSTTRKKSLGRKRKA
jgi:circadian clock protein KaiC